MVLVAFALSVILFVPIMEPTIGKINKNGGTVIGEPMLIPNFGIYVTFLDTEGNRNSIIQPQGM